MSSGSSLPSPGRHMMQVAQLTAGRGLSVLERPVPDPGRGEVLVRAFAVGICGSDVEMYHGLRPPGFFRDPVVPGHEWSGVVVETGPGADRNLIGSPVVCEGLLWCGTCRSCRGGETNLCLRGYAEFGFTKDGGLAQYIAVPARLVHVLPPGIGLDVAALIEPTAVVAHAFGRTPVNAEDAVVIVGDGTLGLVAVQIAAARGAGNVTLFGTDPGRLNVAATLGATSTYNVTAAAQADLAAAYRSDHCSPGADVVIETAGAVDAVTLALGIGRRGAAVSLLGIAGSTASLQIASDLFVLRQLSVVGTAGAVPASWEAAIDLVATGHVDLSALITDRYPLEQADQAFRRAQNRPVGGIKVLIEHAADDGGRP